MIKAIIVDDEPRAAEMLSILAAAYVDELDICAICRNVKDSIEKIRVHEPDIVFLDVELADGLCFEILENVSDIHFHAIFITAHEHYALKAIKFHAFDYLLKPIVPAELETVLKKVIAEIGNSQSVLDTQALLRYFKQQPISRIAVPSKHGLQYFHIEDIVFIEADGNYTNMHLINQKNVLISRKIKDFENTLSGKGFLRVHKSYMVNINHIAELHRDESGYLLMSNNKKVPLGAKDKEDIIELIKRTSYTV